MAPPRNQGAGGLAVPLNFNVNGQRDRRGIIVELFFENGIAVVGAILDFVLTDFAVHGLIPQLCF